MIKKAREKEVPEKEVKISVIVPVSVLQTFKAKTALKGTKMSDVLREFINDYIRKN